MEKREGVGGEKYPNSFFFLLRQYFGGKISAKRCFPESVRNVWNISSTSDVYFNPFPIKGKKSFL